MRARKAKIFEAARGFYGRRKNCFTIAIRAVHRAWATAYVGRKLKKRQFKTAWIQQINAATRLHGLPYSVFMYYLLRAGITVNRKVLADLATSEPYSFRSLVEAVSLARPKPVVVEQLR